MPEQESKQNRTATPDEQERAAQSESYGGQPIDDQELADVWTGGERVGSGSQSEPAAAEERTPDQPAAGEPPD